MLFTGITIMLIEKLDDHLSKGRSGGLISNKYHRYEGNNLHKGLSGYIVKSSTINYGREN